MSEYDEYKAVSEDANRIAAKLRGEKYVRPGKPKKVKVPKPDGRKTRKWPVTELQKKVLAFLHEFHSVNDELPPYWVISQHFGWSSIASAVSPIKALNRKGLLERNEIGNWRFVRESV